MTLGSGPPHSLLQLEGQGLAGKSEVAEALRALATVQDMIQVRAEMMPMRHLQAGVLFLVQMKGGTGDAAAAVLTLHFLALSVACGLSQNASTRSTDQPSGP